MEVNITSRAAACAVFPLALFSGTALAATENTPPAAVNSFSDWLYQGELFGELKSMAFFKEFEGTVENKNTFSAGGDLQYRSADFYGFSVGLGAYSAFDLGINDNDPEKTERYVPDRSVNVLGKAYLRYHDYGFDLRGGRIGLDTPFANEGVGRTMIPALYEGGGGTYALTGDENFKLNAWRIFRFKPYSSDTFGKGDAGAPEVDETNIPSTDTNGFSSFGLRYGKLYNARAEAWYYDFDKRVRLAYGGLELPVTALRLGTWTPFWGVQYAREWDADDQIAPYHNIDTNLYAAKLGVRSRNHSFYLSGTHIPEKDGAFLNGAFFAPYSYGIYDTSPLDIGQPLASMITANQPGTAWVARYSFHNDAALVVLGYTRLELENSPGIRYPLPAKDVNAGFMILGYNVTDRLHLELELDYVDTPNKVTGDYHAERLRMVYHFGKIMPEYEY